MAFDVELLRQRMREIIEKEGGQTKASEKLHVTQPTISKMLSGGRNISPDVMYQLAREYHVSTDYLLGLTDESSNLLNDDVDYAHAVNMLLTFVLNSSILVHSDPNDDEISMDIKDPLIKFLFRKALKLRDVDFKYFTQWKNEELVKFIGASLVSKYAWDNLNIIPYITYAGSEGRWLELYQTAKENEKDELPF